MNKIVSMKEAIQDSLDHGCSLVIEGFTHLISFSASHEIIRQQWKDLHLIRLTPDLVYDQMIEAGLCAKMSFSYLGNPGVGSLHSIRRHVEGKSEKTLELDEYSHHGMVSRLAAGASGLSFATLDSYRGSDIPKSNDQIKSIQCPYTGKVFATVPALNPDVCVIHVQRADREGNAQVWGLLGTQKESAFASKKVIVVAEEIVDSSVIRKDPNRTIVPSFIVDHVVHEPFGCHPSYVQGFYDRDNDFYVSWDQISRSSEQYQKYLEEFVMECPDRNSYIKKMDRDVFEKLKADSQICEGVNYGF